MNKYIIIVTLCNKWIENKNERGIVNGIKRKIRIVK